MQREPQMDNNMQLKLQQPQLLAAIQCVRRWRKSGLGDDEMAAKAALTDANLDALYNIST